jgi:DinB superfamily
VNEPRSPAADLLTGYRRDLLRQYLEQVETFRRILQGWSEDEEHRPIQPGEWSPHQVAWHVRAVEMQAYLPRVEILLAEEHPRLADFDGESWMERHYGREERGTQIVDDLHAARTAMAARLQDAPDAVWSRIGEHTFWGARTLMWWVERSMAHVDEHIQQLGIPPSRKGEC